MPLRLLPGEEPLLDELLDHPEDDAVRLIYADWLEAHGDPRAAYLRFEVLLSALDDGSPDAEPLRARLDFLRWSIDRNWIAAVVRPRRAAADSETTEDEPDERGAAELPIPLRWFWEWGEAEPLGALGRAVGRKMAHWLSGRTAAENEEAP